MFSKDQQSLYDMGVGRERGSNRARQTDIRKPAHLSKTFVKKVFEPLGKKSIIDLIPWSMQRDPHTAVMFLTRPVIDLLAH